MELFQVRYFLALAKALNFTRAAEACNVTQPALTRAIQHLEEELGGPLLYRERSLTQLTELGRLMLPHLEAAYLAAQTATTQAAAFRRRDAAPLRLGLSTTISARALTPVLQELENRIKEFELTLVEGVTDELFAEMLDGKLDAAVTVEPEKLPDRISRWPLFQDRYVVLCRTEHRFSNLAEIPASALAEECVLVRTDGRSDFENLVRRLHLAGNLKPQTRHRGATEDHILHMASAGLGVAISATLQPVVPGLIAVPLGEPEAVRRIIVAAVAGRPHSTGLATFLKLMRARDWKHGAQGQRDAANTTPESKP
jgi:LysR family transcriptional regulator, hydrogen peroxide-inducible genes activator